MLKSKLGVTGFSTQGLMRLKSRYWLGFVLTCLYMRNKTRGNGLDPSHLALSFDSLVDIIIKCFSYIIVSSTNESTFYDQQVIIIAYS